MLFIPVLPEKLSTIIKKKIEMKSLEIKGEIREKTGKKEAKKLRDQEKVPCVLYGIREPVHFYVPFSELRSLVYTPDVFVVNLSIGGETRQAIVQDLQWHPVEEKLLHADFLQINENVPVKIELPVTILGSAKGIKSGGKLKVNVRKIKVKGLVKDLPDTVEVDVSDLDLGQSLKVGDLVAGNMEFLVSKSNVIATITVTRASKAATAGKETK
jgi:large subunit ribosomal protein L25